MVNARIQVPLYVVISSLLYIDLEVIYANKQGHI